MKKVMFLLAMLSLGTLCWAASAREDATERLENAGNVLHEIMAMPDKGIPEEVLEHAKCIAVVPHMVKGGFIFGGKGGKGVATCRTANGWSAPAFITISGGSWGLQIGVEAVDVVLIIQNEKGMQKLLSSNFQIGADASAAAGPVGRHAEAGTDWKMDTEILTYSHNAGDIVGQSGSSIRRQAVPCGNSRGKSPIRSRGKRQKVGLRTRSTINLFERTAKCGLKKVDPPGNPGGLPSPPSPLTILPASFALCWHDAPLW
jgi:lipid-binding SYLF domain-containing protein